MKINIALVGDYNVNVTAHIAIPIALQLAGLALAVNVEFTWLATDTIVNDNSLVGFDGIWCVPGSPYRHMDGALIAIGYARQQGIPFLGTCGGCQHALIEFARHVLGIMDADHAEIAPNAGALLITPLSCSPSSSAKRKG